MLVHLDLVQVQVNTCSHMHGTIREEASRALRVLPRNVWVL